MTEDQRGARLVRGIQMDVRPTVWGVHFEDCHQVMLADSIRSCRRAWQHPPSRDEAADPSLRSVEGG